MTGPAARWAVAQPRMHWSLADNLAEILATLARAAASGAQLCLLPELALSGFHRRLPELLDATALASARGQIRQACADLGLAAVFGLPVIDETGAVLNSLLFIDRQGQELGRVDKRGLTPSEAGFFKPGGARGWTGLAGVLATAVLCRETLDGETLLPELQAALPSVAGLPRVIFWPSYIGASDPEQAALTAAYRQGARALARELGAWVIQSNWPVSLNQPEARGFGASRVLDPQGQALAELPTDATGLAVIDLPHGGWAWQPDPAQRESA